MGGHQPAGQRAPRRHVTGSTNDVQAQRRGDVQVGEDVREVGGGVFTRSSETGGGLISCTDQAVVPSTAGEPVWWGGATRRSPQGTNREIF